MVLAEPGARVGFAGARVVRETLGTELPSAVQTAEAFLAHGFVDRLVSVPELPALLGRLLPLGAPRAARPASLPRPCGRVLGDPAAVLDRLAVVRRSRAFRRPRFEAFVEALFPGWIELHGDRVSGDDPALRGGIGRIDGLDVVVLGTDRGRSVEEVKRRRSGMSGPAGYRKATRLLRLADGLGLPVVTLVDTPGADPGPEAERGGVAFAIAETILEMDRLRGPSVGVILGEGGSGGALALACVDHLIMLESSHYSVISPEGCAAILWRSRSEAARASQALRSTARDLTACGLADELVREQGRRPAQVVASTRGAVRRALGSLAGLPPRALELRRRRRLRRDSIWLHEARRTDPTESAARFDGFWPQQLAGHTWGAPGDVPPEVSPAPSTGRR